ncbi:MAG: hypothetical protein ACOC6F_00820 [bacterium]
MSEDWLEIRDEEIDVAEIMQKIRQRVSQRGDSATIDTPDPVAVAEALRAEMIGEPVDSSALGKYVSVRQSDCDIVPRHYVIDWRIPILGPIHAVVRRVINAEIRRYLSASLKKQSHFNRKALRALRALAEENVHLRRQLEELQAKE